MLHATPLMLALVGLAVPLSVHAQVATAAEVSIREYDVPRGAHPHDVAPAPDGSVWYTAQHQGALGRLDPSTGRTTHTPLGRGSRPHGVIVGPAGDAWVTDSGLNAIVRVGAESLRIQAFPLPPGNRNANLNTASFDAAGTLWFTGQNGVYGRLEAPPDSPAPSPDGISVEVFAAPRGRGPYGIATAPDGSVYYASLAGSYLGAVEIRSGTVRVLEPPTPRQGARRVWADSRGRLWVTGWNVGLLIMHDPATGSWREWPMPGRSRPYAVYVDDRDLVWVSDFGTNAIVRFDPREERFASFPLPSSGANVRQLLGRPGEVWGAESGTDKLVVLRY